VQRTVLAKLVADGLDVVAVEIEDVTAVVVGVVPPQARCAVVGPSCVDGGSMDGVELPPTLGSQRDVKPPPHRLAMALDEWPSMKNDGRSASFLPNAAAASENSIKSFSPSGASAFS
jgi:hypothetical protein